MKPVRSDGRTWPLGYFRRKSHKYLYRLREKLVREVVIDSDSTVYRFRCRSWEEFARCMKMIVKEEGTYRWIRESVAPGDVFYDIGANIGVYTVLAAAQLRGRGRVFAFEPHAANFARLLENIGANGFQESVRACSFALTRQEGFFPFQYASAQAGTAHSQLGGPDVAATGIAEYKFGTSVDRMIASGNLEPPDLVKLDVDGIELSILQGMADLLRGSDRPRGIQVEVGPDSQADILAFMQSVGYGLASRHHTRRGMERLETGDDAAAHVFNAVFEPVSP